MAVMTREEIMAMPAGPDIDRLVAEALGCKVLCGRDGVLVCGCDMDDNNDWPHGETVEDINSCVIGSYSTMIGAAWKVWEATRQKVPYVQLCQEGALVEVCITVNERKGPHITATADTVPLAICRAFLVWKLEEGK